MGETTNTHRILVRKSPGKCPLERLRRKWECKIKMNLTEVGCEDGGGGGGWNWLIIMSNSGLWY
jgi:hypothetical protein